MTAESVLSKLMEFRKLPTYQFERRLDAFVLPYLEGAFNNIFSTPRQTINDFVLVYAEFPLRTIDMKSSDQAFRDNKSACYADYLLWSKTLNIVFVVEFKTDRGSIGEEQFLRYIKNCEEGWKGLLENYIRKTDSERWDKFIYGLNHLYKMAPELFEGCDDSFFNNLSTIGSRKDLKTALETLIQRIRFCDEPGVAFIYLGPQSSESCLAELYKKYGEPITHAPFISLSAFSEYVDEPLRSILIKVEEGS